MKNYIPSLNGLRAVCISIVVISHFRQNNYFPALENYAVLRYIGQFFFDGALAVNTFFIISGFLITRLLINEKVKHGNISLKQFYKRRIIRIFPAYYFLLLIYLILQQYNLLNIHFTDWIYVLFYAKQFHPIETWSTSHLWSLSVEEMFYLAWPLVFIRGNKTSVIFLYLAISTVVIFRITSFTYPTTPLNNTIFARGDALLIGCIFGINYEKITSLIIVSRKLNFVIFILFAISILTHNFLYHLRTINLPGFKTHPVLDIVLSLSAGMFGSVGLSTNFLIGLMILRFINIKDTFYTILNSTIMETIGKMSYSIYLWQQIFTSENANLQRFPILVLVVFIFLAAGFSYYFIEKPFLRLKTGLSFSRSI